MSKRHILHITDYKSPYAYLAKDPTYALEDEFDVSVEWRHFTLDIPSFLGDVESRTETEWRKVRYAYMDMRRWANKRGLTVRGPRRIYDSSPAGIGMQYAQDQGVFRPYNDRVFYRFWNHELEVDDVDALTAVLREAGADADGFAAYLNGEGRRIHDEMRLETEKLGIFGVPSFVLDGEIFWGYDRMELLRERLREEV
ncbi:MAG: DsbA family protein [Alphaproteobacteria bacterium]|jgi:2-hydroxychromene-2-carboxylate isomerase|nr:DsbA family protein [Alphaproteobacteria bacterium]MDP6873645.1 DsbA family protein [Alphaproteobacteria bacterium]